MLVGIGQFWPDIGWVLVEYWSVFGRILASSFVGGFLDPLLGSYVTSSVRQSVSLSVRDKSSHTSCH